MSLLPRSNEIIMEGLRIERDFAKFAEYLETEEKVRAGASAFGDVCSFLGIVGSDLDDYLLALFGLSGSDILRAYRQNIPIFFL